MASSLFVSSACAALLLLTVVHVHGASAPLTMLTDPQARCMDGSLSGYYLQPATNASNVHKYLIHIEGGGECTTEAKCKANLNSALGSSKYFGATHTFNAGSFLLNDNAAQNPQLSSWAHVEVPYCSQDLHSGTRNTTSADTWGLYFSGHLVFAAVLDALAVQLSSATDIILVGDSAGGLGAWMNVDYLAVRFPQARTTVATIAGFYYYAYPYVGVNHTSSDLADFTPGAFPKTYALWQSFVDEGCAAALASTPWACMLSNYSFPYITSESYAIEAQSDQGEGPGAAAG